MNKGLQMKCWPIHIDEWLMRQLQELQANWNEGHLSLQRRVQAKGLGSRTAFPLPEMGDGR